MTARISRYLIPKISLLPVTGPEITLSAAPHFETPARPCVFPKSPVTTETPLERAEAARPLGGEAWRDSGRKGAAALRSSDSQPPRTTGAPPVHRTLQFAEPLFAPAPREEGVNGGFRRGGFLLLYANEAASQGGREEPDPQGRVVGEQPGPGPGP